MLVHHLAFVFRGEPFPRGSKRLTGLLGAENFAHLVLHLLGASLLRTGHIFKLEAVSWNRPGPSCCSRYSARVSTSCPIATWSMPTKATTPTLFPRKSRNTALWPTFRLRQTGSGKTPPRRATSAFNQRHIEPAIRRKVSWTPPKTSPNRALSDSLSVFQRASRYCGRGRRGPARRRPPNAGQQELTETARLLDLSEYRLGQLLS